MVGVWIERIAQQVNHFLFWSRDEWTFDNTTGIHEDFFFLFPRTTSTQRQQSELVRGNNRHMQKNKLDWKTWKLRAAFSWSIQHTGKCQKLEITDFKWHPHVNESQFSQIGTSSDHSLSRFEVHSNQRNLPETIKIFLWPSKKFCFTTQ